MKRIAIYGIGGLYNFGCEAIVRGTVAYIRSLDEDADISYYSKCYEYDKNQIKDLNIKVINIESPYSFFKKVVSKLIDVFRLPLVPFVKNEFDVVINNSDIIFSIGGDIYSIPSHMRKNKKYRYVNKMVEFGRYAKKKNKNLVIYGASIGPFGNYKRAKEYYANHFKEVDAIICREIKTIDYLSSLKIKSNVIFLPDPAFLVANKQGVMKDNPKYIGINLSELSLKEIYGSLKNEDIAEIAQLLSAISKQANLPLLLIPHVYSPFTISDNDYIFLEKIYNLLDNDIKEVSRLIRTNGFIETKEYLSECKCVIAARMHCAVNAITLGVPAILLTYSIKARGMACFVYGDEKWVLPLNEINLGLKDCVINMLNELDIVKERIKETLDSVPDLYASTKNDII